MCVHRLKYFVCLTDIIVTVIRDNAKAVEGDCYLSGLFLLENIMARSIEYLIDVAEHNAVARGRKLPTWNVMRGSYGMVVKRSDESHGGGDLWKGFPTKHAAEQAMPAIEAGAYRKPDEHWGEIFESDQ